jgi:fluoroquinolone resistance protein
LRDCDLTEANLDSSILSGADLRGAILDKVDLKGLDLSGVKMDMAQAMLLAQCYGVKIG